RQRIGTVIWATGFRPDYSWLRTPVFDLKGRLRHHGGFVAPGLYALGLNFMRRRKSSFIHGAEDDVRDLGSHLVAWLRESPASRGSTRLEMRRGSSLAPNRRTPATAAASRAAPLPPITCCSPSNTMNWCGLPSRVRSGALRAGTSPG